MGIDGIIVLCLVLVVFFAFIWEKFPPEIVALGSSAALLAWGILDTDEFLSVFSSSAPITIAMMFIISASLERTGLLQVLGRVLQRVAGGSPLKTMLLMMFTVMFASALMNNTPVVILMTPIVISLAGSLNIAPSKMLIPLSFSAILGGTLTLVGTSTNILMSTVAAQSGQPAIGMFEMTMPGLIFASVGLLYIVLVGRFLLPDRISLSSVLGGQTHRQFIAEVLIPHESRYVGKKLEDVSIGGEHAKVLDIIRGHLSYRGIRDEVVLEAGDRLVIETNAGEVVGLKENGQIEFKVPSTDYEPVTADTTVTMEASIGYRSSLIGYTLSQLSLRRRYGVYVLAVHRQDRNLSLNFENLRLEFADTLLMEGPAEGIKRLLDDGEVINLSHPQERAVRRSKAPIALATILGVMGLAALNVMPIAGLAVIGAVIVMITGCVDADEAFDAIDWRILFLIFGMLGLSMGMDKTGAANWIVEGVVELTGGIGPLAMLAAVYLLTSLLTEMVSNNAVAVLIGPIVITLAQQLGLDPRPFIMAVMFAASASFATPIGYQTNTFVYGAGGYRFTDFLKVGVPLNLIFVVVAVIVLPIFFPF
ncbi:MAG: SLC13 family permease [Xanthomonadales bacterium]|nr:SLC13 family permease [Xanthomonadales bacterium]